jgi:hypothetical protein
MPVAPSKPTCTATIDDCYIKIDWDTPTARGQAITKYEVGRYWGKTDAGIIRWELPIDSCGADPSITECQIDYIESLRYSK